MINRFYRYRPNRYRTNSIAPLPITVQKITVQNSQLLCILVTAEYITARKIYIHFHYSRSFLCGVSPGLQVTPRPCRNVGQGFGSQFACLFVFIISFFIFSLFFIPVHLMLHIFSSLSPVVIHTNICIKLDTPKVLLSGWGRRGLLSAVSCDKWHYCFAQRWINVVWMRLRKPACK